MYPVFTASQHIHLPSYLIWMSLTFTFAVFYFYKRSFSKSLSAKIAAELSLWIMIGIFFGARLLHILAEYPQYYLDNPYEAFKFWQGGFVFYGGFLGGLLTGYLYLKSKNQSLPTWLDHAAPVIALSYAIGRIGCLLAGCCYGSECYLPWAITFGSGVEAPAGVPIHPTQIYTILSESLVFILLLKLEPRHFFKKNPGSLFYFWMILHGVFRLLIEQFRGDFRGTSFLGLYISSYISILFIILGSYLIYRPFKKT